VFDSAIATLQGLFPPNMRNKMILANDTTVVAPLGGYQYVPGQFSTPPKSFATNSFYSRDRRAIE